MLKYNSERIKEHKENVKTEEATKHTFVLPFLRALGYDVYNPAIVTPEFTADIGTKKEEKVDYAIMSDGVPLILIEVKSIDKDLDKHLNQLLRYFMVTPAKFAILTNGVEYRFYTDLDESNKLDDKPFFTFNAENFTNRDIRFLEKFVSENLNLESIISTAETKKSVSMIKKFLKENFDNPSNDFVSFTAKQLLPNRRLTKKFLAVYKDYVRTSVNELLSDLVSSKLKEWQETLKEEEKSESVEFTEEENNGIITTEEEIMGYRVVRTILLNMIEVEWKDYKNFFSIYYNNVRNWIVRLHLNNPHKKELEIRGVGRFEISHIDDIIKHTETIKSAVKNISV